MNGTRCRYLKWDLNKRINKYMVSHRSCLPLFLFESASSCHFNAVTTASRLRVCVCVCAVFSTPYHCFYYESTYNGTSSRLIVCREHGNALDRTVCPILFVIKPIRFQMYARNSGQPTMSLIFIYYMFSPHTVDFFIF